MKVAENSKTVAWQIIFKLTPQVIQNSLKGGDSNNDNNNNNNSNNHNNNNNINNNNNNKS